MIALMIIGIIVVVLAALFTAVAILSILLGTAAGMDTEIEWED